MSDLISRQKTINIIKKTIDTSIIPWAKAKEYVDECVAITVEILEALPSAEPEERTAKVVHKSDTYVVTPPKTTTASYETRTNLWEECGNCHAMGMYHGWNYCPKCGAKLEWE